MNIWKYFLGHMKTCQDTDIVVHHLPAKEDCPPVKQKVRRMRPEMSGES